MKMYTAKTISKYGTLQNVVSVGADDMADALIKIERELAKPGRLEYQNQWVRDGKIVQE